jgi:hypothetical protein
MPLLIACIQAVAIPRFLCLRGVGLRQKAKSCRHHDEEIIVYGLRLVENKTLRFIRNQRLALRLVSGIYQFELPFWRLPFYSQLSLFPGNCLPGPGRPRSQ